MLPLDHEWEKSAIQISSPFPCFTLEDPQCYLNFAKTYLICEMSGSRPPFWLYIGLVHSWQKAWWNVGAESKSITAMPHSSAPYPVPSVCVSLSAFPSKCSLLLPRVRIHGSCMCKPLAHVLNYDAWITPNHICTRMAETDFLEDSCLLRPICVQSQSHQSKLGRMSSLINIPKFRSESSAMLSLACKFWNPPWVTHLHERRRLYEILFSPVRG